MRLWSVQDVNLFSVMLNVKKILLEQLSIIEKCGFVHLVLRKDRDFLEVESEIIVEQIGIDNIYNINIT